MRKFSIFILSILIASTHSLFSQSVKIAVISDVHYLSTKIAKDGDALSAYEKSTGRNVPLLHEVLDKTLKEIVNQKPDILLISGDITNHGERNSHIDFATKLAEVSKYGIQIKGVPGNHDVNVPNAKAYIANDTKPTPSVTEQEFVKIYGDYGYSGAVYRDSHSLSYLSKINSQVWLLALDTNLHKEYKSSSISAGRISPETMKWALNILAEAKEKNITVIGMMHHGLVEHLAYQSTFFSDYLIEDWESNAQLLADAGLQVVFTGHFHANDITLYTSSSGNKIYDVETGSLSSYPFPYRIVELEGKRMSIDTHLIESVKSEPDLQSKYRIKYEQLSRSAISSKLKRIGMPLPKSANDAVVNLLTRMSILHAVGDEIIDKDTYKMIERFAETMGDENFDISTFTLDYPPADNKLTIELK